MFSHGIHLAIDRSIGTKTRALLVHASHPVGLSDQIKSQHRAIVPPVKRQ